MSQDIGSDRFIRACECREITGDHRFEWTRAEFEQWAGGVAERNGYAVRYLPAGEVDPELGPPTQFAVFELTGEPQA